jgi:hypothetical protein
LKVAGARGSFDHETRETNPDRQRETDEVNNKQTSEDMALDIADLHWSSPSRLSAHDCHRPLLLIGFTGISRS